MVVTTVIYVMNMHATCMRTCLLVLLAACSIYDKN